MGIAWCPSTRSEKYFAGSADWRRVFHCTNCIICISNFQMAQQLHLECVQRHGVSLCHCECRISRLQRKFVMCSAPFSTTRNKQSLDWKTSLFLTVCQKVVSHIFQVLGYLHSSSKIAEASIQGWFSDDRIPPETTRWKPVWPGKNGDWRQDSQIQAMSAAC